MSTAEARKILEHPKFTEECLKAKLVLKDSEDQVRQRITKDLTWMVLSELIEVEEFIKEFYDPADL